MTITHESLIARFCRNEKWINTELRDSKRKIDKSVLITLSLLSETR